MKKDKETAIEFIFQFKRAAKNLEVLGENISNEEKTRNFIMATEGSFP